MEDRWNTKVGRAFPSDLLVGTSQAVSFSGGWQLFLFTAYVGINLSVGWPGPDVERNAVRGRAWAHEIYRYTFACPRSAWPRPRREPIMLNTLRNPVDCLRNTACSSFPETSAGRGRLRKQTQMSTCPATSSEKKALDEGTGAGFSIGLPSRWVLRQEVVEEDRYVHELQRVQEKL